MGDIDITSYSGTALNWDTTYYWAVFAKDTSGNWSLLHNELGRGKGTAVFGPDPMNP
jgi:chitodextrinase